MKKGLLICLTFFALMLSAELSWAVVTYTWTGTTNSDWATNTNWSSTGGTHPGAASTDIVIINTTGANQPTIAASSGTITIASLTIGASGSTVPTLTVLTGSTLSLSGGISFTTGIATNSSATLAGAGTITMSGGITISAGSPSGSSAFLLTLTSSVTALNIGGNLAIGTTVKNGNSAAGSITFNVAGGTTTLTGTLTTTQSGTGAPGTTGTATLSVASGATLKLANAAPIGALVAGGTNNFTINSGSTVDYSGTAQTVYTNATVTNLSNTISYSNLTLSGSGTKTTAGTSANNLNISGNFNNNTGSLQSLAASTVFNGTGAQSITLGSGVTLSNVTFSGTGIKTVSAGTMNITGSFTNSLANDASNYIDFTTNSTSVNFTGTTQSIAGGSGTGTDIKTLAFSGGSIKTIASGKINVTSTGTLTLSGSSTLAAGGFLTLKSDASGSAQVATIPSGSSVTGNVNVQRYLTGGQSYSRGWRLLSSPVSASSSSAITPNLTYVHTMAYTTGTTGTGGGFDATGNPTFYFYRENMAPNTSTFISGNFRGVNAINNTSTFSFDGGDVNATLPAGNGFLFFFRGDRATTTNPTTTTTTALATTITATGYLNQGSITVKPWFTGASTLSYTAGTPASVRGFNLVGNPYASSIDWNTGITKNALTGSLYIYNPKLKVYATYISSVGTNFNGGTPNIIPSGQGFFVQANSTLASLTFTEASKVSNQVPAANLLLAAAPSPLSYVRLVLLKDTLNKEEAVIAFKSTASVNYVQDEDADYFIGESIVHLSSRSPDNHNLAINLMPFSLIRQQIPLNVVVNNSGTYTLDLSEAINIPSRYKIYLADAYKKDSVDIIKQPLYTFTADTTNANTFGSSRFYLIVGQSDSAAYKLTDLFAVKSTSGVSVIWKTINESNNFTFTVERSNDGGATYSMLGTLTSAGLGTYSFVDRSPQAGVNIYRLKQEDVYGGVSYTQVSLDYSASGSTSSVSVYPNPATSTIKLAVSEISKTIADSTLPDYTIAISNNTGSIVKSVSTSSPASWQNDVSKFAPGVYFLRVINNNTKTVVGSSKFIKL